MFHFSMLKLYGAKELKFKQSKSLSALRQEVNQNAITDPIITREDLDGVEDGVCAALAVEWLGEKLEQERSGRFRPGAEPDLHAGRNLATVRDAVPSFLQYRTEGGRRRGLFERAGLRDTGRSVYLDPAANVPDSFLRIVAPDALKPGSGAYVGVHLFSEARSGGHALGMYRSRGSTLYFFDPNCGVYAVEKQSEFFAAWVRCYFWLDYTVQFRTNDGATYVALIT